MTFLSIMQYIQVITGTLISIFILIAAFGFCRIIWRLGSLISAYGNKNFNAYFKN